MNPNAAQFSPSNLAVMPYTGAVKANGAENRPQDLIMHESIRQLVQDVQELKSRADGLELENAYLKKTNVQLKQRVELLEQSATKPTTAPAVQSNICGYEPSEASSTDTAILVSSPAGLEKKVQDHQGTVTQILEKFNEHLTAGVTKHEELSKQVNELQYTLKNVKGRTGVLESKFKAMAADMDEVEMGLQSVRNGDGSKAASTKTAETDLTHYVSDKMEKLEADLKAVQGDVDMHRVVINEFSEANRPRPGSDQNMQWRDSWPANNDGWTVGSNGTSDSQLLMKTIKMASELKAMKHVVTDVKETYRRINFCATREALYELFHAYTKDIKDATGEKMDELLDLRDWVIVRLALYGLYEKAMQEAKTADVGV